MASLQNLKAPTLMSKKTQKSVQADEDDVIIDATALPSRSVDQEDAAMEEDSTSTDKPNFAPASAAELKVNLDYFNSRSLIIFNPGNVYRKL